MYVHFVNHMYAYSRNYRKINFRMVSAPSLWWCTWVPDFRQSLPAKNLQQNIKNENFNYDYIYLSNNIWAPEMKGLCIKICVIPKHFIFLFNPLNESLKSALQFHLDCFNSIMVAYRATIMKIVSMSKYIWTWLYLSWTHLSYLHFTICYSYSNAYF